MSETFIPSEEISDEIVMVSFLFKRGEKFRKHDALFEVASCNDKNRTVTLRFVGGFVDKPENDDDAPDTN